MLPSPMSDSDSFDRLLSFLALEAWTGTPQERGHQFERWLGSCLSEEGLDPRLNFRPLGEQVDGSFQLGHHCFLLEAKWKKDPVAASEIYEFKGKVDGKLTGTIGFFLSMSGYSPEAVDALRAGKVVNVLLFDKNDLAAGAESQFTPIFRFKLRAAAEGGEVLQPFTVAVPPSHQEGPKEPGEAVDRASVPELRSRAVARTLAIVVESPKDETVVTIMANRLLEEAGRDRPFAVFVASGRYGLASLANGMTLEFPQAEETLIIGDAEEDPEQWRDTILRSIANPNTQVLIAVPGVEAWLGPGISAKRLTIPDIWKVAQKVDLAIAEKQNPSLREFKRILLEGTAPI
jgi:hypothetical protein